MASIRTGGAAGEHYRAFQVSLAGRLRQLVEEQGISMRELSSKLNFSPPTAGNYIKYPDSMSLDFIWATYEVYGHKLGDVRREALLALADDAGIEVPEKLKEAEGIKRLRAKVLELQGLVSQVIYAMEQEQS
jgi:transcriptional regulator with XRE-family HTH domain